MRRAVLLLAGVVVCGGPAAGQGPAPPAAPGPAPEDVLTFDPPEVRVVWSNRHWQLAAAGRVLKDFGTREQEARQALRLIQELGVNQYGAIGRPRPVMEYWLADGKAPQGLLRGGLRTLPIDVRGLRVEQVNGHWCLRDGPRILFNFGEHSDDAQQALAVIRKYRFDQVGLVGQWSPSMYVFLSHGPEGGANAGLLPPGRSARQIDPGRFSRLAKNADGSPRFEGPRTPSPMAGLEKVASPVVPPLADLSAQRRHEQQAFHWQTQPRLGPPTPQVDPDAARVPFDWRQVQLRQDQGEWKLMAGGLALANFGPSAQEGRLALSALRHYRFGEQWRLGGERPYLTYFTAPARAPRGLLPGLPAEELNPEQLQVKQLETGYALCQGQRVVLRLRDREDDARKLLDTIKKNRFDRLCRIGEPGKEGMTFLVRTR
jgi:hypothetical protein